jgi:hypothetical protein
MSRTSAQRQAATVLGRPADGLGGPTLTSQHPHLTKVQAAHEQITPQPAKLRSIGRPCASPVPPRNQAK